MHALSISRSPVCSGLVALQVIYRILVSTYQRRINARYIDGDEQFHAIDYEIADSSRESSCVVALTITAEPKDWEQATRVAVQEAQRMQQHGITQSELDQYMAALMSSSAQQAAATDTTPHIEMLELAMECLTNGQVLNSNNQAHEVRKLCRRPGVVFCSISALLAACADGWSSSFR